MGKKYTNKITSNAKFEEVQSRKLISAYGGVGSIVETRSGAIMILPFSKWPFFSKNYKGEHEQIDDPRLVKRLKEWFPNLKKLVRMPVNKLGNDKKVEWATKDEVINAEYFPKWMFSPKTRRFAPLEEWLRRWNNLVENDKDKKEVLPPKCIDSYLDSIKVNGEKQKKSLRRFVELEQVRFILTSSSGKICDIPWDRWVYSSKETKPLADVYHDDLAVDEEKETGNYLDWNVPIPKNIYFEYKPDGKFNDLRGISIVAFDTETKKPIGQRRTLAGLFNLRVSEYELYRAGLLPNYELNSKMKVVIRSSNSVYYPNIVSSLYLPPEKTQGYLFGEKEIEFIKRRVEKSRSIQSILEALEDELYIKRKITEIEQLIDNNYIQSENVPTAILEEQYRYGEYKFITTQKTRYQDDDYQLVFEPVNESFYNDVDGISKIYAMDRLKLTSIQPSYTRQEPIDKDSFLIEDTTDQPEKVPIKKMYTHGWKKESITYFPAIESYGEGIFIDFDNEQIKEWEEDNANFINERIGYIQHNFEKNKRPEQERIITAKFIMIHTFSHLIIKELEFLCGYSASSLQERLYIGNEMQGILIYTIAGSEGSYGGLVSLAKSDKIGKIIKSALARATDCASDPICYHTDSEGQGSGGTNLAACYSCALLPETSCEEFNSFLDRRLIVDKDYGYFI
jgi:hypothetical protein